jgi:hypothetical protein
MCRGELEALIAKIYQLQKQLNALILIMIKRDKVNYYKSIQTYFYYDEW